MKKKILLLICTLLLVCGCDMFKDDFSDRYVYTTLYPLEFATEFLYSEYSNVESVYPNGADQTFEVTEKKKKTYSTADIFIYSGVASEAMLAKDLLNLNNKIKIIDATKPIQTGTKVSNIWLDPSNYLMLCSNIKKRLIEYNDNVYVKEGIEKKYKELNEKISEIDVQLYDIGKNGNYRTILATSDAFNYLKKYNINVISLDPSSDTLDKAYSDAKKLITEKKIQYIYYLEGDKINLQQEKLISDNSLVKIEVNDIFSLTDEEREKEMNYFTIMNDIIDNYKKELYKK